MTPEEEQSFIFNLLNNPSTFPTEVPVKEIIGNLGLICTRHYVLDHPQTRLLFHYSQHGCPVDCGKYWTLDQIILMLERGPHVSAKETEATRQLHEETLEKCKN